MDDLVRELGPRGRASSVNKAASGFLKAGVRSPADLLLLLSTAVRCCLSAASARCCAVLRRSPCLSRPFSWCIHMTLWRLIDLL